MRARISRWGILLSFWSAASAMAAAPADFDFAGYRDADLWRIVYHGRFDALVPTEFENFSSPGIGEGRKNALRVAVFQYHRVWARSCAADSKELMAPMVVTTTFSDGSPPVENRFPMRVRFAHQWEAMFDELNLPQSIFQLILPRSSVDPEDLARILRTAGCDSEMVRLFEENLHRAQAQRPSLQDESDWPLRAPLFHRGCASVLAEMKVARSPLAACACAYELMSKSLAQKDLWRLEDQFSRGHFLMASVAKIGQHEPMAECLR